VLASDAGGACKGIKVMILIFVPDLRSRSTRMRWPEDCRQGATRISRSASRNTIPARNPTNFGAILLSHDSTVRQILP
jgi:hypothetical protein